MPDVGEGWLALKMGRKHLGIDAVALRGSAVLIFILFLISTAIEIGRPLVLVRSTVVCVSCDQVTHVA